MEQISQSKNKQNRSAISEGDAVAWRFYNDFPYGGSFQYSGFQTRKGIYTAYKRKDIGLLTTPIDLQ